LSVCNVDVRAGQLSDVSRKAIETDGRL